MQRKWEKKEEKGNEKENKIKEKGSYTKLVFACGTLEICYWEENLAKHFRGGGEGGKEIKH